MRVTVGAAALLLLLAGPARADDKEATGGTSISYKHKGQFGFYSQLGVGYRAIFRYNGSDFCGEAGKGVCTGTTPPWIELGVSYGVSNAFEILVDMRLGLGADFLPDTSTAKAPHEFVVAPGFKFYVNDLGSIKWFSTLQFAIDGTDYSSSGPAASVDVGIRNVNGILVDLHRTFGIYAHFGETIGFVRWLRFEMDGGIGLQVRFP
jgi:hypothetical protein